MKIFAEVMNGTVNLIRDCEDAHVLECAPPLQFVVITPTTGPALPGYTWDGAVFAPPPPPSAEVIAGHRKGNIDDCRRARQAYLDAELDVQDYSTLALDIAQKGVKALAVKAWLKTVKALFLTRSPLITATADPTFLDFSSCGPIPYSMIEVAVESDAWLPPVLVDLPASPTTAQIRSALNALQAALRMQGIIR